MKRPLVLGLAGLLVVLLLGIVFAPGEQGRVAGGNAVIVLNAGSTGVDSIVIEADPPGTHGLAARHGYLAPLDSALVVLPGGAGDADVRVWRDRRVVADHLAYFGGRSLFEVRVGDSAQAGRYRRTN